MRPFSYCKLEIFLPASHLSPLETALRQVDAGHIGAYDSCLSYSPVTSCWRPLAGTTPYLGTQGALSREHRADDRLFSRGGGDVPSLSGVRTEKGGGSGFISEPPAF